MNKNKKIYIFKRTNEPRDTIIHTTTIDVKVAYFHATHVTFPQVLPFQIKAENSSFNTMAIFLCVSLI